MKKTALFILIILLNPLLGQEAANQTESNSIKIIYNCVMTNSLMTDGVYTYETELIINDSISQFILNREKKTIKGNNEQMDISALHYINNYNFKTDSLYEQRKLNEELFLTAKWKNDYQWKITDETKEINGYKVIKATTSSIEVSKESLYYSGHAIAWFAADIPIPTGPARYVGLPGLILEIEYEKYDTKYTLKSIEFNSEEPVKDISEGVMVDKLDVIYFFHNNKDKIKKIQKDFKKK